MTTGNDQHKNRYVHGKGGGNVKVHNVSISVREEKGMEQLDNNYNKIGGEIVQGSINRKRNHCIVQLVMRRLDRLEASTMT